MPKLPNVTTAELQDAIVAADNLIIEVQNILERMRSGYNEPLTDPGAVARTFAYAAREASAMVAQLLYMDMMQKTKAMLNGLRAEASDAAQQ